MNDRKPFKKVDNDGWLGGVCGGMAYAFGWPVLWVRIFMITVVLASSNEHLGYIGDVCFIGYIIAWIFAPDWESDPEDYKERTA